MVGGADAQPPYQVRVRWSRPSDYSETDTYYEVRYMAEGDTQWSMKQVNATELILDGLCEFALLFPILRVIKAFANDLCARRLHCMQMSAACRLPANQPVISQRALEAFARAHTAFATMHGALPFVSRAHNQPTCRVYTSEVVC